MDDAEREKALEWLKKNATDSTVRQIVLSALPERLNPTPMGYTNTFWNYLRTKLR